MTRIYTRSIRGELKKFDTPEKITHKQAIAALRQMGFKHKGAVLLVYL